MTKEREKDLALAAAAEQLRRQLRVTQEQLAEQLECSYMTARRIEMGYWPKNRGVLSRLKKLARKAEVTLKK